MLKLACVVYLKRNIILDFSLCIKKLPMTIKKQNNTNTQHRIGSPQSCLILRLIMAYVSQGKICDDAIANDEQTQSHHIIPSCTEMHRTVEIMYEGVCSHHLGGAGDGDQRVVQIELRGYQAFDGVVQRVAPVHEHPEGREVVVLDHGAAEQREQCDRHAANH